MVAPGCLSSMAAATRAVVVRTRHRLALVVDEEAPVGVAVEGQPDVGAGLEDPRLQGHQVLGLDGVGRMVGEGAVQLAEEDLEMERQAGEHRGHHQAAHAVGGVGDDLAGGAARRASTKDRTLVGVVVQHVDVGVTVPRTGADGEAVPADGDDARP